RLHAVDDRPRGDDRIAQQLRAGAGYLSLERAVAERVRGPQLLEIRRESLGEPQVAPLAFGDGIAEPLVRGLVRDRRGMRAAFPEAAVGVEDRARALHPAESPAALKVRELLVRKWRDQVREEVDDVARVPEIAGHRRQLLG